MKILPLFLQFQKITISREIEAYKEYLSEINTLTEKKKKDLLKFVDEIVKENPKHEHDIHEEYSKEYELYNTKYSEYTNNNSFIGAYSFFELQLSEIFKLIEKYVVNKKGHVNPKNGSYAEKLKKKIYAISGQDFSSLNDTWEKIDKFKTIRNIIVHNGGNLIEDSTKTLVNQDNYSLLSSFTGIIINSENGDFYINEKLVNDFLDLTNNYLKKLVEKLEEINKSDIR